MKVHQRRLQELRGHLEEIREAAATDQLSAYQKRSLRKALTETVEKIDALERELDPIAHPGAVFDPSDPRIVGRFVSLALVAQPSKPLSQFEKFYGSGVYAIYYSGDFEAYDHISGSETPIYVGKASPPSNAKSAFAQGPKLSDRLGEHRKNIEKATSTLNIEDFSCRALVVQSGYETAAESYLIHLFRPIWNSETRILYGLGKHGDSASTRANKRSPWDTLHPGRKWAMDSEEDAKSTEIIFEELEGHFAQHPAYPDLDSVMSDFLSELRQI